MANSRYEQAKALHQEGRTAQARAILVDLLADEPSDVGARYALAICLIGLGERQDAQGQLRQVLTDYPQHYEAAYQLGCLLQDDGRYDQAVEAFRQVLVMTDLRDTKDHLRHCEAALSVPHSNESAAYPITPSPVTGTPLTPGPPPVRRMIENTHVADRGRLVRITHLAGRHILPLKSFFIAVLGIPATMTQAFVGASVGLLLILISGTSLLTAVISLVTIPIRTRMYTAQLYEYGMDVNTGVLRRSKQFIWYYQITEPPTYVRKLTNYLTNTASLLVSYNNTASTSAQVELRGIGSPEQVNEVRAYLQSRIPPERLPIRGPWT
jgi:membrane protein YdbS with pleckstrin-like domain